MILKTLDWMIIISFFIISLLIGLYAARTAGKSMAHFFSPDEICHGSYYFFL